MQFRTQYRCKILIPIRPRIGDWIAVNFTKVVSDRNELISLVTVQGTHCLRMQRTIGVVGMSVKIASTKHAFGLECSFQSVYSSQARYSRYRVSLYGIVDWMSRKSESPRMRDQVMASRVQVSQGVLIFRRWQRVSVWTVSGGNSVWSNFCDLDKSRIFLSFQIFRKERYAAVKR